MFFNIFIISERLLYLRYWYWYHQ